MVEETGHVKVLDIGMAGLTPSECRLVQGAAATRQVFYLAPEQAKGGANDVRSDIYSLGCVIHHALAGKVPFPGAAFDEIVTAHATQPVPPLAAKLGLPPAIDSLLAKMMAKSAIARPASMDDVVSALRALRDQVNPNAHSESAERDARAKMAARTRPKKLSRKNDSLPGWATALVWLLILVGAMLILAAIGVFTPKTAPVAPSPDSPDSVATTPGHGTPKPVAANPAATTTADPLAARWLALQPQIDASTKDGDWAGAETALAAFIQSAQQAKVAADNENLQAAQLRAQQLQNDGDDWFGRTVKALPVGDDPATAAQRLNALAALRDQCLANARADAESRYQEALAILVQDLSDAKRKARLALQAGKVAELPGDADALAAAFKDSPVAGMQKQFAAMATEAAQTRPLADWATTRGHLAQAKGADALPAAAALLLSGDLQDIIDARRLLDDPALAQGDLLRRRAALAGTQAAVLSFKDLGDLQFIEELAGNPRLANGALGSDDAAGIACTVPVGGDGWSAALEMTLTKAAADAEARVSCVAGQAVPLTISFTPAAIAWKIQTAGGLAQDKAPAAKNDSIRLRLACHKGQLRLLVDDQQIATFDQAQIPAGSQFRLEIGGYSWRLKSLQVLGGD
jgi:hypothetical protein